MNIHACMHVYKHAYGRVHKRIRVPIPIQHTYACVYLCSCITETIIFRKALCSQKLTATIHFSNAASAYCEPRILSSRATSVVRPLCNDIHSGISLRCQLHFKEFKRQLSNLLYWACKGGGGTLPHLALLLSFCICSMLFENMIPSAPVHINFGMSIV